jgi:hypothetical protein
MKNKKLMKKISFFKDKKTVVDIHFLNNKNKILKNSYFERLQVLEYYRNFKVPEEGDRYAKWHEWKKNVLSRESVKDTL